MLYNILWDALLTVILGCRSTVHSSTVTPIAQPNLLSYENRQTEEASNGLRVTDTVNGNPSKASRPPPRVPTGTPLDFSL